MALCAVLWAVMVTTVDRIGWCQSYIGVTIETPLLHTSQVPYAITKLLRSIRCRIKSECPIASPDKRSTASLTVTQKCGVTELTNMVSSGKISISDRTFPVTIER